MLYGTISCCTILSCHALYFSISNDFRLGYVISYGIILFYVISSYGRLGYVMWYGTIF